MAAIDGVGILPEDLVIGILSWLPVKSLIRFKCVCKSWRALFENPTFITKHLANDRDGCLLVKRIDRASRKTVFSLLSNETLEAIADHDFPYARSDNKDVKVVGCCDSIFCAVLMDRCTLETDIVLWNPATRILKILPQSNVPRPVGQCRPDLSGNVGRLGFGFDAKTNDYKVVQLVSFMKSGIAAYFYHVEVYELSTDTWKKSDAVVPSGLWFDDTPYVYMNGMCYWLARNDCDNYTIVSFDISKQVFNKTTTLLPDVCAVNLKPRGIPKGLTVVNESVAMIVRFDYVERMNIVIICEVWVLNEYGVKESWTKLYTSEPHYDLWRPLGYWKSGCLFADSDSSQLVLFNLATKERKNLQLDSFRGMSIHFYKESLIPLLRF